MELDILKQWDECPMRDKEREMWKKKKENEKTMGMQIDEENEKKNKWDMEWLIRKMGILGVNIDEGGEEEEEEE